MVDDVPELLPESVRLDPTTWSTPAPPSSWIHAPETWGEVDQAQQRYRFEEALVTQLVLADAGAFVRALGRGGARGGDGGLLAAFDERLPFSLTAGQREIGAQIEEDLAQPHPDEPAAPG